MAERTYDLGIISAYGYAKEGGYTGTETQFKTDIAKSANYANNAAASATTAETHATNAATSELNAYQSEAAAHQYAEAASAAAASLTVDDTLTQQGQPADAKVTGDKVSDLNESIKSIVSPSNFETISKFGGPDKASYVSVPTITLSANGDYIEFVAKTYDGRNDSGARYYAFACNDTNNVSIGLAYNKLVVRSSNGTDLVSKNINPSLTDFFKVKISYENGNVVAYINDEVFSTYTGQLNLIIERFGWKSSTTYWHGEIKYININGTVYNNFNYWSGCIPHNIDVSYLIKETGLIDPEIIKEVTLNDRFKMFRIVPDTDKIHVYFPIAYQLFGRLDIYHHINATQNLNYWRIGYDNGGVYQSSDGITFTSTDTEILVGAENECAIQMSDDISSGFIAGWHGYEDIITDNTDYIVFIVNGHEMSASDLTNLGAISCESFAYRERSTIYAPKNSTRTTFEPIMKHTKLTEFIDGGFKTTNYVEMAYSTSVFTEGISIHTAFTGLFCVAAPFALQAIGDTGKIYTGVHPSTNTILGDNPICNYSRAVKMKNNNKSCKMDSKVLFSNIAGYNPPPLNTHVTDRQTDLKYYSYFTVRGGVTHQPLLPVANGDFFATEAVIKWEINN